MGHRIGLVIPVCAVIVLTLGGAALADEVDDAIAAAWKDYQAGSVSEALASFEGLKSADPDDVRPNARLAYILLMTDGDLERVFGLLVEHLEAHRGDAWALDNLSIVAERSLATGLPSVARNCAKILTKEQPGEKEHRYLWARASFRIGERDSVIQACRRMIDDYRSWELPYWLLARTYSGLGRYGDVVQVYRDLLKEQPGNVDARMRMAQAQLYQRDYDGAGETYLSALKTAEPGSSLQDDAEYGLEFVEKYRDLTKRLRKQDGFLRTLLIVVFCAWGAVIVVLVLLTRPSGKGR